jgi:hypothetical protein
MRLYEFAWRRARAGRDLGTVVVEGLGAAREQIERAFQAAVRRELSRSLHTLDGALGFSSSAFVLDWFRLSRARVGGEDGAGVREPLSERLDERVAS